MLGARHRAEPDAFPLTSLPAIARPVVISGVSEPEQPFMDVVH
jgi:hypothetical protein